MQSCGPDSLVLLLFCLTLSMCCLLMMLQNPTLSVCWCVGLCQIMIPVISFSVDTTPFCKSVGNAEAVIFVTYSIFAFLCCLLGPAFFDLAQIFTFYKLPFSYTSWADLIVWVFLVVYIACIPITRRVLERYEQRAENRVVPLQLP